MPRYDTLPSIGRLRVYDAGPNAGFADRFLVLFEDMDVYDGTTTTPCKPKPYGVRQSLSLSERPNHPLGVSQWGEDRPPATWGHVAADGPRWRRIPFASLPDDVRLHVIGRATWQ